jgi:hypothetical protein
MRTARGGELNRATVGKDQRPNGQIPKKSQAKKSQGDFGGRISVFV